MRQKHFTLAPYPIPTIPAGRLSRESCSSVADSLSFLPLSLSAFEAVGTVAVPSHLHYPRNTEKPLNGLRLAVKDIFDLNGVRTAASNRSFRDLYPPRTKTAGTIQRLIDQGAIIVGKTKTTTFADRELATSDWIDTHSPFNPRGDGYIWGGGSSTGSAAAVAAYDWLDFAVGIDSEASNPDSTLCIQLTRCA